MKVQTKLIAEVIVTIESTWDDSCAIKQVKEQTEQMARLKLHKVLESDKSLIVKSLKPESIKLGDFK